MFVQMAWGRVKTGAWEGLQSLYVNKVIPLTVTMQGLQGRQLWRGSEDREELAFWSVWDTLDNLRRYETSEARRQLAEEAEQYFYPLAYAWGETWIKHFEIVSTSTAGTPAETSKEGDSMHVMIAWGKLRLGAWDRYEKFYRERVEPTTWTIKGLRERQLLRSTEDPDEGMSISFWETPEDLSAYERSELRQNLAKEIEDLYRGEFWVKHFEITESTGS